MSLMNFISREAEPQLLKEGDNVVNLYSYVECKTNQDVRVGADGKLAVAGLKSKSYDWVDTIDQVALHLGNETGSLVHRASESGCKRYSDLTPEEIATNAFVEIKTFACTANADGQLVRVESPGNTAIAKKKFEDMLFAIAGGIAGLNGRTVLDNAIKNKTPFIVTVKKEPWKDPETGVATVQMVVIDFKPYTKKADANQASEIPSSLQA